MPAWRQIGKRRTDLGRNFKADFGVSDSFDSGQNRVFA